jgi:hypothetical protein
MSRPPGARWHKQHPIQVPDWRDPEDRFCHYCHKQYANLGVFKRHIVNSHGTGLAKVLGLVPVTDAERFRIEWGIYDS